MTDAALHAKARRQLRQLQPWLAKAAALIKAKVADARAHAEGAVTETLRQVPDGRATARKANRSPRFQAALNRLDELWEALTGPSAASLRGLIRDAREDFYRTAFAEWRPIIPAELWVSPDPEPTQGGVAAVRGAILHGVELRHELERPIAKAKRDLLAVVTVAGRAGTPPMQAATLLATWQRQAEAAILATVRLALSDSQIDADTRAGRDLIHDDYLDERPVAVGA